MLLTLTALPVEMLEAIASHLDAQCDLCSLSVTCKALHLSFIRQLFHTVQMSFRLSPDHVVAIGNFAPLLQALSTTARTTGATVTAPRGSLVQTLRIDMDTMDEFFTAAINDTDDDYFRSSPQSVNRFLRIVASVLQTCPDLTSLELCGCGADTSLLDAVATTVEEVLAFYQKPASTAASPMCGRVRRHGCLVPDPPPRPLGPAVTAKGKPKCGKSRRNTGLAEPGHLHVHEPPKAQRELRSSRRADRARDGRFSHHQSAYQASSRDTDYTSRQCPP